MLIQSERTVLTLSNAIALASSIIQEVAGHEVADTLNGSVVSKDTLDNMIASQINKNFSNYTRQI